MIKWSKQPHKDEIEATIMMVVRERKEEKKVSEVKRKK